ncbi:MAG: hypothetical protein KDC99_05705 [Cyclobacteriaceae bacterium]|nr:hypothetical protein [Cyclobacteriaceae bacterium]
MLSETKYLLYANTLFSTKLTFEQRRHFDSSVSHARSGMLRETKHLLTTNTLFSTKLTFEQRRHFDSSVSQVTSP